MRMQRWDVAMQQQWGIGVLAAPHGTDGLMRGAHRPGANGDLPFPALAAYLLPKVLQSNLGSCLYHILQSISQTPDGSCQSQNARC